VIRLEQTSERRLRRFVLRQFGSGRDSRKVKGFGAARTGWCAASLGQRDNEPPFAPRAGKLKPVVVQNSLKLWFFHRSNAPVQITAYEKNASNASLKNGGKADPSARP